MKNKHLRFFSSILAFSIMTGAAAAVPVISGSDITVSAAAGDRVSSGNLCFRELETAAMVCIHAVLTRIRRSLLKYRIPAKTSRSLKFPTMPLTPQLIPPAAARPII